MWKCFCIEVINLRGQSDSSDLSCVLKVLPVVRPAAMVLPGLGAVAAGSRWGDLCVTGQGPGVWRRLQLLHVPPEQGEQGCRGVARLLTALALQQLHQEVDVAHGQAQDLVLAQLLLRRVGGDELAELCEGGVHVVLAPAFPGVGEHLPGHGAG